MTVGCELATTADAEITRPCVCGCPPDPPVWRSRAWGGDAMRRARRVGPGRTRGVCAAQWRHVWGLACVCAGGCADVSTLVCRAHMRLRE